MKKRITTATVAKTRERKICQSCSSLNVDKYRKRCGFYRCRACHAIFPKPGIKKVKTSAGIPTKLKEIIEKKERQTVAYVKETIL
jgi:ribosomal protein L37AE/L43A